jgi:hypothetical protein
MDGLNLHDVLAGTLFYLNRTGFSNQIAPLMRKLETHHDPTWQVLLWTNVSDLERFRAALAWTPEVVPLAMGDWRERAEFLDAVAQQGGLELLFDGQHVFRTSEAMLEVEAQKTLTACL